MSELGVLDMSYLALLVKRNNLMSRNNSRRVTENFRNALHQYKIWTIWSKLGVVTSEGFETVMHNPFVLCDVCTVSI